MEFHENLEYEQCSKFLKKCKKNVDGCSLGNHYLKELAELGFDAIISGGAHVVYPFKINNNHKEITEFSLGNSIFDSNPGTINDFNNETLART